MLSNEARPGAIAATSQSDMQTLAPEVAPFWMLHPEQCACARIMGLIFCKDDLEDEKLMFKLVAKRIMYHNQYYHVH